MLQGRVILQGIWPGRGFGQGITLVIGALALDFSTHPFLLAEVISNAAEKFPLYDDMFKAITLGEGAPWSFLEKGQCTSPPPSPDERAQVQLGRCRYMDLISLNEMDIHTCMNPVSLWLICKEYDVPTSHAPIVSCQRLGPLQ
jgi:hypothetical protein